MSTEDTSRERLVLGVDGGGTKTLAWLATCVDSSRPTVVGRGVAGASNPQAVGMEEARAGITAAVRQAFENAGRAPAPVDAACLALAGVGREAIRQELQGWAESVPFGHGVLVVHDAQAVLAGGSEDGTGVAVICGTGSFAYGITRDGIPSRSGGWGYLLGDEGSGFSIGCAALRAVARAADGRGPSTLLTDMILKRLELDEPAQLIPTIYDAPSARHAIAALAPTAFEASKTGDSVAQQILQAASVELGQLVRAVAAQLDFVGGQFDLALAGSVLVHQPSWAESVQQSLAQWKCAPRFAKLVPEPVAGAVVLACRML